MMKNFMVCYTYTFGCDVFECQTKEEARQKAVETIKNDFLQLPMATDKKTGKTFQITNYEELIEDIFEYEEEEEGEEE